jgi:chitinase family 18 (EC:3.2.1.14)
VSLGGSAPDTQAPSVPANLAASGVTQTTVDLSWSASTDNVGVTGYDIYQGNTNIGTVTGTSTQVTGLTASTAYSFRVRARDAAGNISGYSNTVNITTASPPDTQAPSIPANLAASNITNTTVDLSWSASTDNVGVTGYDVYQGNTNLGTVAGTSTQVTGLTAATAYSFRVRARDAAGNLSGYSNTVNVTTTGGGGGGGCTGGIATFPYTESF